LRNLNCWTEIAPVHTFENDIGAVRRLHREKMAQMRTGKDWYPLVAKDDVDILGE